MDLLAYRDEGNDTAIHLAALNGHTDIVKALLPYTNWDQMRWPYYRHPLFRVATAGRHVDIMRLLEPFSDADESKREGLISVAEASRQGFIEGVEYLLSPKKVMVNSLNSCWDKETKEVVMKTPLDLALEGEHTECIRVLKEIGAVTSKDIAHRRTSLWSSILVGMPEGVELDPIP
jgi:hypothetical protein